MKVSVVLNDWSVRESFHGIDTLACQTWPRDGVEIVWAEQFDRAAPAVVERARRGLVDQHLVLGDPPSKIMNKHRLWNEAVLATSGDVVVIGDSDVIFPERFVETVARFFDQHDRAFLHFDEIRSGCRRFYPFPGATTDEVMAAGELLNWDERLGTTRGLAPAVDALPFDERQFVRNYGAFLCLRRDDWLRMGGLDEHEVFCGLSNGPYELSARLLHAGFEERWERRVLPIHTWHPYPKFEDLPYMPNVHQVSLAALKHHHDGDVGPWHENEGIRAARRARFPEPVRRGPIEWSLVVANAPATVRARIRDAAARATTAPFELIFVGGTAAMGRAPDHEMRLLPFAGGTIAALTEGVRRARGRHVLLHPSTAQLRARALDRIGLLGGRVALSTLETDTHGFVWRAASAHDALHASHGAGSHPCVALPLPANATAIDATTVATWLHDAPTVTHAAERIDLDVRLHHAAGVRPVDDELDTLLHRMLVLAHEATAHDLRACSDLLHEIEAGDAHAPGSFARHTWLRRWDLIELHAFAGVFRRHDRSSEAGRTFALLVRGITPLLARLDSGEWNGHRDVHWVARHHRRVLHHLLGSAHWHLSSFARHDGDDERAIAHLQACLNAAPDHRAARAALDEITDGGKVASTQYE